MLLSPFGFITNRCDAQILPGMAVESWLNLCSAVANPSALRVSWTAGGSTPLEGVLHGDKCYWQGLNANGTGCSSTGGTSLPTTRPSENMVTAEMPVGLIAATR